MVTYVSFHAYYLNTHISIDVRNNGSILIEQNGWPTQTWIVIILVLFLFSLVFVLIFLLLIPISFCLLAFFIIILFNHQHVITTFVHYIVVYACFLQAHELDRWITYNVIMMSSKILTSQLSEAWNVWIYFSKITTKRNELIWMASKLKECFWSMSVIGGLTEIDW